jgi:hypothetical protein
MIKSSVSLFSLLLFLSCAHHTSFQEQLNENFANHLKRIDSTAGLDSVHVLWKVSATEKLGRIIDDSIYMRDYVKIQGQLQRAVKKNEKDSIEFLRYELNYIKGVMDSLSGSISKADTTLKFGYMMSCAYHITRNHQSVTDSTIIFIDSKSIMRFTEYMDSSLSRTLKGMN